MTYWKIISGGNRIDEPSKLTIKRNGGTKVFKNISTASLSRIMAKSSVLTTELDDNKIVISGTIK